MTSLGIAAIGAGITLVACGVKDLDPRAVFLAIFTGKPLPAKGGGTVHPRDSGTGTPSVPGSGPGSKLPPGTSGSGGGGGGTTSW